MKILNKYLSEIASMDDEKKIKTEINVAGAIVKKINEDGTELFLIIQRSADDFFPNHWEIPRGKCDNGPKEKLIACCMRETLEETGLKVKPIKYIDKFSYIADKGTRRSTQYNFLCEMINPNQKIKLSDEHQNFKWISEMSEAELYVYPETKRTLSKIMSKENQIVNYPSDKSIDNKIKE